LLLTALAPLLLSSGFAVQRVQSENARLAGPIAGRDAALAVTALALGALIRRADVPGTALLYGAASPTRPCCGDRLRHAQASIGAMAVVVGALAPSSSIQ
jgi:hypothetical protein